MVRSRIRPAVLVHVGDDRFRLVGRVALDAADRYPSDRLPERLVALATPARAPLVRRRQPDPGLVSAVGNQRVVGGNRLGELGRRRLVVVIVGRCWRGRERSVGVGVLEGVGVGSLEALTAWRSSRGFPARRPRVRCWAGRSSPGRSARSATRSSPRPGRRSPGRRPRSRVPGSGDSSGLVEPRRAVRAGPGAERARSGWGGGRRRRAAARWTAAAADCGCGNRGRSAWGQVFIVIRRRGGRGLRSGGGRLRAVPGRAGRSRPWPAPSAWWGPAVPGRPCCRRWRAR